MAGGKIEFKLTGAWKQMAAALDPKRLQENLDANISRATQFNGMMVAGEIRKRIKARKYAKNAPLTTLIKKSSTPLVDDADLFGAVTSQTLDKYTVFVGVLRSATTSEGKPMVNLAELLHNGGQLPVTEHMRNMFILLSEVGQGKRDVSTLEGRVAEIAKALGKRISQIKPLKASTRYIVIPPRPFLLSVLDDPIIHKRCERNWRKAVDAAFRDQASGSPAKGGAPSSTARAAVPRKTKPPKPKANRSEAAKNGHRTRRANKAKKQQQQG